MSAKIQEVQSAKGEVNEEAGGVGDPWGDYLRKHRQRPPNDASGTSGKITSTVTGGQQSGVGGDPGDQLTEEDRRTLIVGGWLQDTRRATIEEEPTPLLQHPEIRHLLDTEKLAIYGPRRSVGMLTFVPEKMNVGLRTSELACGRWRKRFPS